MTNAPEAVMNNVVEKGSVMGVVDVSTVNEIVVLKFSLIAPIVVSP